MPFVKLDTGILDSSLWSEPAQTCKCWITLLAMANADGSVNSTAPGIARRANLGLSDTEKALEMFESPDSHSRSLNDDGKRIKRVDGGYQIVNYGKYRERDYTAAERMRRHRANRNVTRNACNETVTLRKQKQKQKEDKKAPQPFVIEDWLSELQKQPCYARINVREEFGKAENWCNVRGLKLSKQRFVNWINKAEKPLNGAYKKPAPVYPKLPPSREPTQAEIENARAIAKTETQRLRESFKNGGDSIAS